MCEITEADAIRAGQYVRCAGCGKWVGPSDPAWLPVEGDAVLCGECVTGLDFGPGVIYPA
jgi:hypothetical protein